MLKVKTIYDNREELAAALRSGKWKQAIGNVTMWPEGYACVMGVGAAAGVLKVGGLVMANLSTETYEDVFPKLGIRSEDLFSRNDNGWSFENIADWLESLP